MTEQINFEKISKFKLRNKSTMKYEVIKIILAKKLIEKYKEDKYWIGIYTEFEYKEGLFCSIYFYDVKKKMEKIFDITTKKNIDFRNYNELIKHEEDLILINPNNIPDDIEEISKELEKYI